jgi:outer membrane lipoprotein-sorting protein
MSDPEHFEHHPHRHAPRVAVAPSRPSRTAQVVGGLAGALLVAAAAMAAALLLVATTARGQGLPVEAVLAELEQRAARLQDITFVLEGEVRDEAGQRFAVEVEVLAIPSMSAASLYIVQPDALADNMVVVHGDEVRNYTFLTNQVAIFDIADPDAFGGLVQGGDALALDLDLGRVFAGWDARVEAVERGGDGDVYTVRFDNRDPDAAIHHAILVIDASDWLPLRLTLYSDESTQFADLRLMGLEVDTGLDVAEVTWLPDDAEVLDRRR